MLRVALEHKEGHIALQSTHTGADLVRLHPNFRETRLVVVKNLTFVEVMQLSLELAKIAVEMGATEEDFSKAAVRAGVENGKIGKG